MRELVVVGVETGLIIGFAVVAKWIVHINLHFAIFASVRALQPHNAGKILRDIGPAIAFVSERFEFEPKWFVVASKPHRDLTWFVLITELLLCAGRTAHQPTAKRSFRRDQLDKSTGNIALIGIRRRFQRQNKGIRANSLRRVDWNSVACG